MLLKEALLEENFHIAINVLKSLHQDILFCPSHSCQLGKLRKLSTNEESPLALGTSTFGNLALSIPFQPPLHLWDPQHHSGEPRCVEREGAVHCRGVYWLINHISGVLIKIGGTAA